MNNTIRTGISILQNAIENNLSATQASKENGMGDNYLSNMRGKLDSRLKSGTITNEEYSLFKELYEQVAASKIQKNKNVMVMTSMTNGVPNENLSKEEQEQINYNADTDDAYDERSKGEIIRGKEVFTDKNGIKLKKITEYKYNILIRDEAPLKGDFTREEMDAVYRLYSNMDGAGMTVRSVSREFPSLSFKDFKRILRAFNITKSSLPIAPHTLEEMSEDDLVASIRRSKEHSVLKKLDNDRLKYYERRFIDSQRQIIDIQSEQDWAEKMVGQLLERYTEKIGSAVKMVKKQKVSSKEKKENSKKVYGKPVISVFGDIHYGKKFDSPIFGRGYNKDIAHERMMKIAESTVAELKIKNSNELVMLCLGDILETAMEGMHPNHRAEMDVFQDEQIFYAFESMREMLEYVINNTDVKITFGCIHGNHDRIGEKRDSDKSRTAGKIVSGFLKKIIDVKYSNRVEFILPANNLFKLVVGELCIFAQHGDSSLSKKKPSEIMALYGENRKYSVLFKGHWHFLKTEEGTNNISIQAPSVASTDKYIMEELGNNNLPGFIIGSEPENGPGFDFKKITLY